MLSIMKGPIDVGVYAPGVKVLEVILILPQMFIGTILPIYSRYIAKGDSRIESTIQKTFDLLSFAMVPIVGGVFVTASQIVSLIAGSDYLSVAPFGLFGLKANAALSLQFIIFAGSISFIVPVFQYVLIAAGKQNKLVLPNVLLLILNVTLNFIFIPRYSFIAASLATVATELAAIGFIYYLARQEVRFSLSLNYFIRSILSGLIMVAVLYFLKLPLLSTIVLGGVTYGVAAWVFKAYRPELIDLVKAKLWPKHA
jgi:O-antigen/teichoic acid export membrane protein